jgi:uncharacterized protein DUF4926
MTLLDDMAVVRLLTDRYREAGVARASVGTIVDVYDDAYEVEFSRDDGTTIAWFAVERDEVEPVAAAKPARAVGHGG